MNARDRELIRRLEEADEHWDSLPQFGPPDSPEAKAWQAAEVEWHAAMDALDDAGIVWDGQAWRKERA